MRVVALLLAVAAAGAGCGSGEEGTRTPAEQADAAPAGTREEEREGCGLVTRDEVAAALGGPVGEGASFGLRGCAWKGEGRARVQLQAFAGPLWTPRTCDAQKQLVSGRQEPVPGLGDTAVWGSSGDLVVCTARAVVKVDVDDTEVSPDRDRETAAGIARAALPRL